MNKTAANAATEAAATTAEIVPTATAAIATAPTSKLMQRIMKQREATAVKKKTASIADLFKVNRFSAQYNHDGIVTLPVREMSAKYVDKYHNATNEGFITSYHTESGELFTCFSSASLRFFRDLMTGFTGQELNDFARLTFNNPMMVTIAEDSFEAAVVDKDTGEATKVIRKTYRFEVVGGGTDKVAFLDNKQLSGINDAVEYE